MKTRLLLSAIPAIACMAFAAPALAAEPEGVSENWSGYMASSQSDSGFSAVSGAWTQPAAKCTAGEATYSAFWVGLGGGSEASDALEQTGTQADCTSGGTPVYYAWYELVPSAPVKLALKVSPGDSITSKVSVTGDQVTISVSDKTTGQSVTKTLTMTNATPDTSTAEWIAEAPSECAGGTTGQCSPLPLADFGTVTFRNASATASGHTGSISDPAWTSEAVELSPQDTSGFMGGGFYGHSAELSYTDASSGGASPSSLNSGGSAFTIKYATNTSSSGTSPAGSGTGSDGYGGAGYGYGGGGYGYGYGPGGYGYGGGGYGGGYGGYGYGSYGSYGYDAYGYDAYGDYGYGY
jgi:hypothetical protein